MLTYLPSVTSDFSKETMIAGPPSTQPSSLSTSPMFPNKFQPPILPPNFQGNLQQPPVTQLPRQPPVLPPNSANIFPSSSRMSPTTHPPPPPASESQQPWNPQSSTMTNGMNQPLVQHPYMNSGTSSSLSVGSKQPTYSPPPIGNSQPPVYNQPPTPHVNGAHPYLHNRYPRGPSPYNGSPSSLPPTNPSPPHYPNLPSPPSALETPLNGPTSYPGQRLSSGLISPSVPQSRIDPEMIPSVTEVLAENQEKTQSPFVTKAPGLVPPMVSTNFICQDQGSCNPRLMRSTTYAIPNTNDLIKQSHIPVALSISPLADLRPDELEPPMANFGEIGPVRCHRCKAYMCSFMQFIDGGKRFICCFCQATTDVPAEYFNHLDHSGRRMDWHQRPELCLGAYEILATKQYCKDEKWPEPPAFLFMIDVSYNSVRSGLVEYICHILKNDLLDYLPKERNAETSKVRVGFATYDKQIHFYNIKSVLSQPHMMIVSDLEDIFVPLRDGFLCSPHDSRGVINSLLDQIPQTFAKTQETETILAPVIQSGLQALKGANCSGKIYIFSTTLPNAAAPGKLSNRDDKKLHGTDKEKILLSPINDVYTKLGEECAQNGCAVDLFAFANNYYDLATIGEVCRLSGGEIYKFNYFTAESDGERLFNELKLNFQRTTAFDALMRVRTSSGIRPVDFLGNFYMTNTTEMIFGTIDSDKSVAVELKHDDKLPNDSTTYAQVALLYTSISGQRRLRILTLALTVTSSYTSLYLSCDFDTILNYLTKVAVRSISISTPLSIRDNIIEQATHMLACYRKYCSQTTATGQLILPETLKLLPVYVASLLKSEALAGTQAVPTDDRSWLIHRLMSMNIKGTSVYLYPRIYPLHTLDDEHIPPAMIRCSYDRFSDSGAYVIENGLVMYVWLGSQIDPTFVQSLFGLQTASLIQPEKCRVVELDNPVSKNVRTLLNMIRCERNSYMKFLVIKQRDSLEPFFRSYLVEDQSFSRGASYIDFLYHLHREIRNVLS